MSYTTQELLRNDYGRGFTILNIRQLIRNLIIEDMENVSKKYLITTDLNKHNTPLIR